MTCEILLRGVGVVDIPHPPSGGHTYRVTPSPSRSGQRPGLSQLELDEVGDPGFGRYLIAEFIDSEFTVIDSQDADLADLG